MEIRHLSAAASEDELAAVLGEENAAIVDRLVDPALLDRAERELDPFLAATPFGPDAFAGRRTKRTGALISRSGTCRDFVVNPLVLAAVDKVLSHSSSFQLHLTQVISIDPGEPKQRVHRDQWAFAFFPFPKGYEVSCNTLWAMTDFTEENGATRVIPGSHRFDDRLELDAAETAAAEMEKGSVLIYTGSVYHGAGANRSTRARRGVNITYSVSWLRQEEN
jgi:ectoine hydroxylase-related dioxygenase (phytanoyl-CoA dioxygenase family)